MLGYVSKHTLTDFKSPKNTVNNVSESRNSTDLKIDSKNTTENNDVNDFQTSNEKLKLDNISSNIEILRLQM